MATPRGRAVPSSHSRSPPLLPCSYMLCGPSPASQPFGQPAALPPAATALAARRKASPPPPHRLRQRLACACLPASCPLACLPKRWARATGGGGCAELQWTAQPLRLRKQTPLNTPRG